MTKANPVEGQTITDRKDLLNADTEIQETEAQAEEIAEAAADALTDENTDDETTAETSEESENGDEDSISFTDFLNQLHEDVPAAENTAQTETTQAEEQSTQSAVAETISELTEEQFEEIKADRTKFAQFLSNVEQRAAEKAVKVATEQLYPVIHNVSVNNSLWTEAAISFKHENSDLKELMPFIAQQVKRIVQRNPQMRPADVYDKAGSMARQALRFHAEKAQSESQATTGRRKSTSFAPKPNGRKPVKKQTSSDPQVSKMRELMNF